MDITKIIFKENSYYWEQSGRVFLLDGKLYRGIAQGYVNEVLEIFRSGLIDELIEKKLIPLTVISEKEIDSFGLIIEHHLIEHVTFPVEWPFQMLKDAAMLYLEVNIIANKYGYELQDAHPYNIVFEYNKPYFVDLGSIVPLRLKNSWSAYNQFYSWFSIPLKLFAKGDYDRVIGILNNPSSDYSLFQYFDCSILPNVFKRFFLTKYLRFRDIFLLPEIKANTTVTHASLYKDKVPSKKENLIKYFRKTGTLPLFKFDLNNQKLKIEKINFNSYSDWGGYQNELFVKEGIIHISDRFKKIACLIADLNLSISCELAANEGLFTEYLLENDYIKTGISIDYDLNAVNQMYNRVKNKNINIIPILSNPFFPTYNCFNSSVTNRLSGEIVIALAVTHHLILTQKMSLDFILNSLIKYTTKYICIEFMPLGLWHNGFAPPLPVWYTEEWFMVEFQKFFDVIHKEKLELNRIVFIGKLKSKNRDISY